MVPIVLHYDVISIMIYIIMCIVYFNIFYFKFALYYIIK